MTPTPRADVPRLWWSPSMAAEHGKHGIIDGDASGSWRVDYNGPVLDALPFDAVRLVPAVVKHRTNTFVSAGGFYGWQCTCGVVARCFTDEPNAALSGRMHEGDAVAAPDPSAALVAPPDTTTHPDAHPKCTRCGHGSRDHNAGGCTRCDCSLPHGGY